VIERILPGADAAPGRVALSQVAANPRRQRLGTMKNGKLTMKQTV
jgi:hypothetical protein